jgi:hypothetical protein
LIHQHFCTFPETLSSHCARSDDFEPVYPTGSPQPINDQIKHPRMPDVGAASSETWTLLLRVQRNYFHLYEPEFWFVACSNGLCFVSRLIPTQAAIVASAKTAEL